MQKTQLSKTVNLSGDSMIEIVLCTPPEGETTEDQYKRIRAKVVEVCEPLMKEYLEGLRLTEKMDKVNTIEDLEEESIVYLPLHVKERLAETIDELIELSEGQKMYLLTVFLSAYLNSAAGYCNTILQKRAQKIAYEQSNKKKIITQI